jgi:hypothetical protein
MMAASRGEEAVAEHPAVRAWLELSPAGPRPEAVERLKRKAKGAVYRLIRARPGGAAVIAKRCHWDKAQIERAIYETVLPRLPEMPFEYHGFVEERDERYSWLFLEDVGDERYCPGVAHHRSLVASWLALLHTTASDESLRALVPDRGPEHYREHLRSICETLPRVRRLESVPAEGVEVLRQIGSCCEQLESSWRRIETLGDGAPRTVVHDDCLAKNVHLRARACGLGVAPFDWGGAGWGLAVTDLGQLALPREGPPDHEPDYAAYRCVARSRWPFLDLEAIRQLANLGQLFWALKVIDRGLREFECDWARAEDVVRNLGIYAAALGRALRVAGAA